jgi:hypothetical protein
MIQLTNTKNRHFFYVVETINVQTKVDMDGTSYDVHVDQFFRLEYTSHTFDSVVTKTKSRIINLLPARRKMSNTE